MSKTVTIRMDENAYSLLKTAAEGSHRPMSNFIEWAAISFLRSDLYVDDNEMDEINKYSTDLRKGLAQAKKRKYSIVK